MAPVLTSLSRKIRILAPLVVLAAAGVSLNIAAANTAESAAAPRLFGTIETRSGNVAMFPKWGGALSRYFNQEQLADKPCTATTFNRCHLSDWRAFLKKQQGRSRIDQIRAVNDYMNRQRYLTDPRNYGVSDYWATPAQFFKRNGDCEDYAIAKFMSLRALGIPNSMMRVVVLQDLNLRIGHAILVVYINGKALVLDNQVRRVVSSKSIRHYKPIYSINENHWWLHRRG